MSEWQPIDGDNPAPRDGTLIIVGAPGFKSVAVRHGINGWQYPFTLRRLKAYEPTAWQPMPAAPLA